MAFEPHVAVIFHVDAATKNKYVMGAIARTFLENVFSKLQIVILGKEICLRDKW
jgi:hypothetical protein